MLPCRETIIEPVAERHRLLKLSVFLFFHHCRFWPKYS